MLTKHHSVLSYRAQASNKWLGTDSRLTAAA